MIEPINFRAALLTKSFAGIGPITVERLLSQLTAEELLAHLDNERNRELMAVTGINKTKLLSLHRGCMTARSLIDLAQLLDKNGFKRPVAPTIYEIWGKQALSKIRSNPYRLLFIASWDEVDPLGLSRGPEFHPCRVVAAIEWCMVKDYEEGKNSFISKDILFAMVKDLIGCNDEIFQKGLKLAIDTKTIVDFMGYYELPAIYIIERSIERILGNNSPTGIMEGVLDRYLDDNKYRGLMREQSLAIKNGLRWRYSVLYGKGGRGKTFTLSAIADGGINLLGKNIILGAVAAKACRRINEETGKPAYTVASLIHTWKKSEFQNSIVIIDEASMLSLLDFYQLIRKFTSSTNFILVGDPHQIPSVQGGRLFYDIIRNNVVPNVELTENKRQDNHIDGLLNQILAGEFPTFDTYQAESGSGLYRMQTRSIAESEKCAVELYLNILKSGEEVQIISPLRQFDGGSESINQKVHRRLFNRTDYCKLTPVVFTKNMRVKYGIRLINGSVGFVTRLTSKEDGYYLEVLFENEGDVCLTKEEVIAHLEMSYCLTTHKAQGSSWGNVIIVLPTSKYMINRNMIYTAMSRCRSRAIIIYNDHKFISAQVKALPIHEKRRSLLFRKAMDV